METFWSPSPRSRTMLLSQSTANRMLGMLTLVSVQANSGDSDELASGDITNRVLPVSLKELLAQYGGNPSTRPGLSRFGDFSTDDVAVDFSIDRYHGINQRAQTWGLTGYMRAEWHDARLEYDGTASHADHLTLFPAQAAQVWQPDLYFENYVSASSISGTDGYGESLTIYPDGRVVRSQQRSFTFACHLHLDDLPFDVQQVECTAELPLPLPLPLPLTLPLTLTLTLTPTLPLTLPLPLPLTLLLTLTVSPTRRRLATRQGRWRRRQGGGRCE